MDKQIVGSTPFARKNNTIASELKGKIVADRNVAKNNPNKPSDSKVIFAFFSKIVIQNIYLRCTRLKEEIIR